ncbi:EF-hand domain-containing protein [Sphingomonas sabuli]|uniref:EF-hand domain-containing protein n=1 Tax=Sphingomonas sabuli TaxID=2764186 RepID=A0A7G9KZL3_9SPHN|nr:EF-hand domain-containing protein [Sphingomonas sabuli]QNM81812.1 EF-hand domain-containing protein [Sphingomonas sabuli]
MLTRNLSLIALLAAAAVPAVAQAPAGEAPKSMTKAQMTASIDGRFGMIDTNKDGFLSKEEIGAVQQKVLQQASTARSAQIEAEFKKLDGDSNGSVTLAEFKNAVGQVKASETPDQVVAAIDTNKDGKIAAAEYRTGPLAQFDKLDVNKDGTLTQQEAAAGER